MPPLHAAAVIGDLARCAQLLDDVVDCGSGTINHCVIEVDPTEVNAKDSDQATPCHYAARAGKTKMCAMLLNRGADVDARDVALRTPLITAVEAGHLSACALLLACGAEVNTQQFQGISSLHYASEDGNMDLCRLLLAHGIFL
jgi:ankyrin repeat protein